MDLSERLYYQDSIRSLRPYILSAFFILGKKTCARCGCVLLRDVKDGLVVSLDRSVIINHKRYGENITINDLELLCGECNHAQILVAGELHLSGGYCPYCQRPY